MKIAFIKRNFSYYGGAERYLATFINQLKREGHEIHIFANKWVNEDGVFFHKVNILPLNSFIKAYTFNKNLKINLKDFDSVISFERTTSQHIYRAGEGCHVRWLEIRSKIEPWYKKFSFKVNPLHRYYLSIEKKIFEETPLIISNSEMVKNEIIHYYGINENKIKVIYNGVDMERFLPKNKEELRNKYNFPNDIRIILFVGSGFKRKGLDTLIKALSIITEKDILLLIVGKGDEKYYKKICINLDIERKVLFLGIRKDIENFYALSDIFVLPTLYDPFSNATLEAMATGIPVITTKNNGVAELINNGKEGYVIHNPLDYEELAEKIEITIKKAEEMGKYAKKKAEEFSIERASQKFIECIKTFFKFSL
ncbi:MAG: glycosyltransferase family 4 protein [Thermodesulfovibrio sp.]